MILQLYKQQTTNTDANVNYIDQANDESLSRI
jgi:hypothetical protein